MKKVYFKKYFIAFFMNQKVTKKFVTKDKKFGLGPVKKKNIVQAP